MTDQQDLMALAMRWQAAADYLQDRFSDDISDAQQYVLRQCASEMKKLVNQSSVSHITPVGGNVFSDLGFSKAEAAELQKHAREAAAQLGWVDENAVGCLTISRWKGADSMVNHDFDYYGNLPDGSYSVYTRPQLPAVVPDGWMLVPMKPTQIMLQEGWERLPVERLPNDIPLMDFVHYIYEAMLAAAPQPDNKEPSNG